MQRLATRIARIVASVACGLVIFACHDAPPTVDVRARSHRDLPARSETASQDVKRLIWRVRRGAAEAALRIEHTALDAWDDDFAHEIEVFENDEDEAVPRDEFTPSAGSTRSWIIMDFDGALTVRSGFSDDAALELDPGRYALLLCGSDFAFVDMKRIRLHQWRPVEARLVGGQSRIACRVHEDLADPADADPRKGDLVEDGATAGGGIAAAGAEIQVVVDELAPERATLTVNFGGFVRSAELTLEPRHAARPRARLGEPERQAIFAKLQDRMRGAARAELVTLLPWRRGPGGDEKLEHFYGWDVYRAAPELPVRCEVTDRRVLSRLVSIVEAGIALNNGRAPRCFLPRHGVRFFDREASPEASLGVVICLQCQAVRFYESGRCHSFLMGQHCDGEALSVIFEALGLRVHGRSRSR